MTSCRFANFFVFFFYNLRKPFSFSSLPPEEFFLYCFFKKWGNFSPFFLKKNMTGNLRHTALDCSLSMHWLDIPFLHLFLSFSLCLNGASFEKDKALPPWNMWRSFKNEGIRHPGVPCMWFGGDFWGGGEVGELLPCHGLFVSVGGVANAKAEAIMEVHTDSWIVAICTSQNWSSSFSQCQY